MSWKAKDGGRVGLGPGVMTTIYGTTSDREGVILPAGKNALVTEATFKLVKEY